MQEDLSKRNTMKFLTFLFLLTILILPNYSNFSYAAGKEDPPKPKSDDDPLKYQDEYKVKELDDYIVKKFLKDITALINAGDTHRFKVFSEIYMENDVDITFSGTRKVPTHGSETFFVSLNNQLEDPLPILLGFFEGDLTFQNMRISNDLKTADGILKFRKFWKNRTYKGKPRPSVKTDCFYTINIKKRRMKLDGFECELFSEIYLDPLEIKERLKKEKRLKEYLEEEIAKDSADEDTKEE